ncbi:hypothetical protein J4429_03165 [Candidatus Pacearchaeota archaeon]|nr:hypothetical protein [Candidatus Pacearchaeota archaeon]
MINKSNMLIAPDVDKKFAEEVFNILKALKKELGLKTTSKMIISNRKDITGLYIPDENIILISEFGIKLFAEKENLPIYHSVLMNVLIHEIYHSILKGGDEETVTNLTDKAVEIFIEKYLGIIN